MDVNVRVTTYVSLNAYSNVDVDVNERPKGTNNVDAHVNELANLNVDANTNVNAHVDVDVSMGMGTYIYIYMYIYALMSCACPHFICFLSHLLRPMIGRVFLFEAWNITQAKEQPQRFLARERTSETKCFSRQERHHGATMPF